VKYRRLVFLAPVVASALLGLACSQAEVHPAPLGDCLDPVKCNPPSSDGSVSTDAAKDGAVASDAKSDADSGDAGDAATGDAAKDASKDGDADAN
jgi:hypothetical protein